MPKAVLTPGSVHVLVLSFPRLDRRERAQALDFRLRTDLPLPRDRYKIQVAWLLHESTTAVVAVFAETGSEEEDAILPFPFWIPMKGEVSYCHFGGNGYWMVHYKNGLLASVDPFVPADGPPAGVDLMPNLPGITLGKTVRRGPPSWLPLIVAVLILATGAVLAAAIEGPRQELVARWTEHAAETKKVPQPSKVPVRSDFPLVAATAALHRAWNGYATVQSWHNRDQVLEVEGLAPSAVDAWNRLRQQPGLEKLELKRSENLPGAREHFVVVGEVQFENW